MRNGALAIVRRGHVAAVGVRDGPCAGGWRLQSVFISCAVSFPLRFRRVPCSGTGVGAGALNSVARPTCRRAAHGRRPGRVCLAPSDIGAVSWRGGWCRTPLPASFLGVLQVFLAVQGGAAISSPCKVFGQTASSQSKPHFST